MTLQQSTLSSDEILSIGKEYALGSRLRMKNLPLSVDCFRRSMEQGNIKATFRYALSLFEGEGIERNRDTAQELASQILEPLWNEAKKGDIKALQACADAYSFGLGVPQDLRRAFLLYLKAAEAGDDESQCSLGFCYFDGLGTIQNLKECVRWWTASAEAGYPHSCCDLGTCYLSGFGIAENTEKAVYWFQKASTSNYSPGSSYLGKCHYYGIGVEKNLGKATEYYRLAIEQDYERGCRSILSEGFDLRTFLDRGSLEIVRKTEIHEKNDFEIVDGCVYINRNIVSIDTETFIDQKIRKILVELDNPTYKSIDGCLYDKSGSTLLFCPNESRNCH